MPPYADAEPGPAAWASDAVQLEPVDWSKVRRQPFAREFLALPSAEEPGAEARRKALGVRIEDLGSLVAAPAPVETFEELGEIPAYALESLREHGIVSPMPIQSQALPLVLSGCDVIGLAQTGSGKTLAFLLPAVVHIEAQESLEWRAPTPIALVLAPTRELAVQISDEATKVLKGSKGGNHRQGVWAACLYGGGRKGDQVRSLQWGAHIVVATPGRLLDFVSSGLVSLKRVTYLVLDEADRMLDFGFQGDVAALSSQVRPERQVLFFSATWSTEVQELARGLCHGGGRPVRISVGQNRGGAAGLDDVGARQVRDGIIQEVVVVDFPANYERQVEEKRRLLDEHLASVLSASEEHKVLVFVSQKNLADELAAKLWDAGFKAAAMHGGKTQDSRLWTLDQFRQGDLRLLVATDVIGRGIDIPSVSHVVVFEMGSIDDYVHRIGRTARGKGAKGHALVFFEYWHKDSSIAAQLVEVLAASKQPVPEGLRRIAAEVASGQREGAADGGAGKWGNKWKPGGGAWNGGGGAAWSPEGPQNGGLPQGRQRYDNGCEEGRGAQEQDKWGGAGRAANGGGGGGNGRAATPPASQAEPLDSWEDA